MIRGFFSSAASPSSSFEIDTKWEDLAYEQLLGAHEGAAGLRLAHSGLPKAPPRRRINRPMHQVAQSIVDAKKLHERRESQLKSLVSGEPTVYVLLDTIANVRAQGKEESNLLVQVLEIIDSALQSTISEADWKEGESFRLKIRRYVFSAISHVQKSDLKLNESYVKIKPLKDAEPPIRPEADPLGNALAGVSLAGQKLADLSQPVSMDALLERPDVRQARLLEEISRATLALTEIQNLRSSLVEEARSMRVSWNRIGDAAGITPQAAYRRWDPEGRQKHLEAARNQARGR